MFEVLLVGGHVQRMLNVALLLSVKMLYKRMPTSISAHFDHTHSTSAFFDKLGVSFILLLALHVYASFCLIQQQDKRSRLLRARSCVARLPSQAIWVEPYCGQGRAAERVVPAVILAIKLSVEHFGPASLTVGHIQPLSLPEHSKSPVCPPVAVEQRCRCSGFPLFQD
jgi:hypothetical protein